LIVEATKSAIRLLFFIFQKKSGHFEMNKLFESVISFHKKHRILTHILYWLLILVSGSFQQLLGENFDEYTFLERIAVDFLNNFAKIPTAYFVVYYLFPRAFEEKKYFSSLIFFVLGGYFIYILASIIRIFFIPYLGLTFAESEPIKALLTNPRSFYQFLFLKNMGGGAAMLLIKMILNHAEMQRKTLTIEKQKVEIELKSLKNQLNPHFLFNTLNNIYSLSLLNSPKTSASIARLSEILDYILYQCNTPKVPLKNEIVLLENYIGLEKLRYDDRLLVFFSKSIEKEVEIAPLILLTLVENAFKHGAGEDMGKPTINIAISVTENEIDFVIENSYFSEQEHRKNKKGIGLQNLQHQLELIYGDNQTLSFEKNANTFKVTLKIKTL
jgi:sensor histidine kinase YesM